MSNFKLSAIVGVTAFTEVEAETLKEALEIAKQRPVVINARGQETDENWVISDADGEPVNIEVQEDVF